MKPIHVVTGLLFCFIFFVSSPDCNSQTRKIAIVSVADTTLIHQHLGFTAFTNFIDTIHINFSIINRMEKKLQTYLSPGFSVSVVQLPDSVLKVKNGFFSQARTKKIKQ